MRLSSKMTATACASPGAYALSLDQAISECACAGVCKCTYNAVQDPLGSSSCHLLVGYCKLSVLRGKCAMAHRDSQNTTGEY